MSPRFNQPSQIEDKLQRAYQRFFKSPLEIEQSWCGASDRTVTGLPFFGQHQGIYYGLGYSGNGVLQTYLGGKFISALVLGLDNEYSRSGMAKGPLGRFPHEPVRYIGANMVKRAISHQESCEYKDLSVPWWSKKLASFASAAGKADK